MKYKLDSKKYRKSDVEKYKNISKHCQRPNGLDKPARLTIRFVLDLFLMVRRVWQPLWSGCKIFEGPPLTENSLKLTEND